jgi:hypothetical protein
MSIPHLRVKMHHVRDIDNAVPVIEWRRKGLVKRARATPQLAINLAGQLAVDPEDRYGLNIWCAGVSGTVAHPYRDLARILAPMTYFADEAAVDVVPPAEVPPKPEWTIGIALDRRVIDGAVKFNSAPTATCADLATVYISEAWLRANEWAIEPAHLAGLSIWCYSVQNNPALRHLHGMARILDAYIYRALDPKSPVPIAAADDEWETYRNAMEEAVAIGAADEPGDSDDPNPARNRARRVVAAVSAAARSLRHANPKASEFIEDAMAEATRPYIAAAEAEKDASL